VKITTNLEWNDLVLDANTASQVEEIRVWIVNKATLEEESHLKRFIGPGYRVFFYGASGTGKKISSYVIGKSS
jgi:SpoVK/Ycf46/Vps4 family AAA+-type ATPase